MPSPNHPGKGKPDGRPNRHPKTPPKPSQSDPPDKVGVLHLPPTPPTSSEPGPGMRAAALRASARIPGPSPSLRKLDQGTESGRQLRGSVHQTVNVPRSGNGGGGEGAGEPGEVRGVGGLDLIRPGHPVGAPKARACHVRDFTNAWEGRGPHPCGRTVAQPPVRLRTEDSHRAERSPARERVLRARTGSEGQLQKAFRVGRWRAEGASQPGPVRGPWFGNQQEGEGGAPGGHGHSTHQRFPASNSLQT